MPPATLLTDGPLPDSFRTNWRNASPPSSVRASAGIGFVRVGEDPASKVYVGRKEKTCAELGIASETHVLPEATSESDLLGLLARLNSDPRLHGILVQAPLPSHIRAAAVYANVLPQKDVDGFNPLNVGKLMLGDPSGFLPCTPAGIRELLVRSGIELAGAELVVLGRGTSSVSPGRHAVPKGPARERHGDHLPFRHARHPGALPAADILVAAMECRSS